MVSVLALEIMLLSYGLLTYFQEQSLPYLRYRHRKMFVVQVPGLRPACEELEEIRGRYLLGSAES